MTFYFLKQDFFTLQTRLLRSANKACLRCKEALFATGVCTNGIYNCKQAFYNPRSTNHSPLLRHTVRRVPAKGESTGFRRHSSEKVCRFPIIRQKKRGILLIIRQKIAEYAIFH